MDQSVQHVFGARVRELRERLGFSQEELAGRAGLDRTYISSCERGRRNVSLSTISKLAVALSVSLDELLKPPSENGGR